MSYHGEALEVGLTESRRSAYPDGPNLNRYRAFILFGSLSTTSEGFSGFFEEAFPHPDLSFVFGRRMVSMAFLR